MNADKFCVNCAHYRRSAVLDLCMAQQTKQVVQSLVTGKMEETVNSSFSRYAHRNRQYGCGEDARWFVPKPLKKDKWEWIKRFMKSLKSRKPLTFQDSVGDWLVRCFGEEVSKNLKERNHRFLEEALELVQANGCSAKEAHKIVEYVFSRPIGELSQEVGGTMITLASLCHAANLSMQECADIELARIQGLIDEIRERQARKPKFDQ